MTIRATVSRWLWVSLCAAMLPNDVSAAVPGKVRLFILSGQSNMARFDPTVTFTPALKKAYPQDEVIVVKSAQGGQPIRRWYKEWKQPPDVTPAKARKGRRASQDGTPPGDLYDVLMKEVQSAVGTRKVDSVAFLWMQGERDAKERLSNVYADALAGLIRQIRNDLKRPDMVVVIGRLSDNNNGNKDWDTIRAAQQKLAEADPLARWVDTDDLNGPQNALHYDQAGYAEFGRRLAARAVELLAK